jgi:large subunit ribosomal protein L6
MILMITVEVPNGIQVDIEGNEVVTKGSLGSNTRSFNDALLKVSKEGSKISISGVTHKQLAKKAMMAEKAFAKQLRNDIDGVAKHYERNMQVIFAHFPITVESKGDTVLIKNLIGERAPREAKIAGATKVEVKGTNIRVYGTNINDVSQTCANMRKACKIREKDGRVFQDGVYFALE